MRHVTNCPHCQSENIRSFDNQPLFHPTSEQVKNEDAVRYDGEAYLQFVCDDCKHEWQEIFQLIQLKKEPELLVIVIPSETSEFVGTNDVTYAELEEFMNENEGDEDEYCTYSLADYFTAQNDEYLGQHWSYLIDKRNKVLLNAL